MRLYIKQRFFSVGQKFEIYDENECVRYRANKELISLGAKIHVEEALTGREVVYIAQDWPTLLPRFRIFVEGREVAVLKKEFTFLVPRYVLLGTELTLQGDYFDHDYSLVGRNGVCMRLHKVWFAMTDCYELDIAPGFDERIGLGIALAVDMVLDTQDN